MTCTCQERLYCTPSYTFPTPTIEQLFLSSQFLLLYLCHDQEDHRNNKLLLREVCIVESSKLKQKKTRLILCKELKFTYLCPEKDQYERRGCLIRKLIQILSCLFLVSKTAWGRESLTLNLKIPAVSIKQLEVYGHCLCLLIVELVLSKEVNRIMIL